MSAPSLFDPALRGLRLSRARAGAMPLFLHQLAADEMQDRLQEINRTFTDRRIIGPFADIWPGLAPALAPDPATAQTHADTETLPLAPGSLDLVLSALSLHHLNDPVGQLVQMRRALRPDGLCLAVLFGGRTLEELRACLGAAEIEMFGGLSPRVAPMAEIRDLGGLLQRAGFALPVADSLPITVSYRSATHLMHELRAMGETNIMAARQKQGPGRAFFDRVNAIYAAEFPEGDGRVRATFELVFLTGWAPADGQQKPLRPGSAAARLADALGTVEQNAGDKTHR